MHLCPNCINTAITVLACIVGITMVMLVLYALPWWIALAALAVIETALVYILIDRRGRE